MSRVHRALYRLHVERWPVGLLEIDKKGQLDLSPIALCWQRIGGAAGAAETAVPGGDSAEYGAIWVREDAPGKARRLCAPLQYRLLPFCSFPLPICAHPLVSQRIIKIFGTRFKEKNSRICGFPYPRFIQCWRHMATVALLASCTHSRSCDPA